MSLFRLESRGDFPLPWERTPVSSQPVSPPTLLPALSPDTLTFSLVWIRVFAASAPVPRCPSFLPWLAPVQASGLGINITSLVV